MGERERKRELIHIKNHIHFNNFFNFHRALEVSMLYGGPTHLKLIAEWEMETKANVFGVVPEIIPDPHDSVMELRQLYQQPLQCSLSDCLHIYTKEETVSVELIKSCIL